MHIIVKENKKGKKNGLQATLGTRHGMKTNKAITQHRSVAQIQKADNVCSK